MSGRRLRLSAVGMISLLTAPVVAAGSGLHDPGFDVDAAFGTSAGWSVQGVADEVEIDRTIRRTGAGSLRIRSSHSDNVVQVTQTLAADTLPGNRVRLRGVIKTEGVAHGYAGLWIRVDGAQGTLFLDNMRGRGVNGTQEWSVHEIEAPLPERAEQVVLGVMLRGEGAAWFDELGVEALDTTGWPPPSAAARRYLDTAVDIMEEHSVRRASIDWPGLRREVMQQARGARSPSETYAALRYALQSLGDHHSFLVPGERQRRSPEAGTSDRRGRRTGPAPRGALLAKRVGYLWLPGFRRGTHAEQVAYADELHELMKELDAAGACAWVVDLRSNNGGNLWPMLAGMGPLLGQGEAGAAVFANGERVPLWYRDGRAGLGEYAQLRVSVEPYRPPIAYPPVAVLTSPVTASSAETILIGFYGRSATRSFGEPTRGASTGTRAFSLADGAVLHLAVATVSDRAGRTYGGVLMPDHLIEAGKPTSAPAREAVVEAALRWIDTETSCEVHPRSALSGA